MKELMRSWTQLYYTTGKQMDMTMFEHSQISHLQCGQRYPGPCPHCPLCWAAIQSGSGTSQTQQVSAIRCQSVLLEHNEHMMWHSVMIKRYITYASICICNGRHWICTSKFGVLVLLWSGHSWASHLWTAFISEKN